MRDAVDDNGIQDTERFRKLLRACAAFTGELINYNDLGNAAGVSGATAKEWVRILRTMGIIFLLEPYFNNELKRKLDEAKQALAEKEAADRLKQAKMEAVIGLAKIGLTVTGTLAAIVLTGTLEETTILNKTCLGWVKAITPRI